MEKSTQMTRPDLSAFEAYVKAEFSGDVLEMIDYFNLSLRVINKQIDREEDPEGVANVIDNLFGLQQAFIGCARDEKEANSEWPKAKS